MNHSKILKASLSDKTTFLLFVLLLFVLFIVDSLLLKQPGTCQQGFPFIHYAATTMMNEQGGSLAQSFYPQYFALNLIIIYIIAVVISFLTKLGKR